MAEIVRHVREVRAPRLDARDDVERLGHGEVRGVRLVAQRVDHQRVDAVEQRPRLVGEPVAVGQVGEVAEAEAEDRHPAVPERHRDDAHAADDERAVDLVRLELRDAAAQPRRRRRRRSRSVRRMRLPRRRRWHSTGIAPPCMTLKRRISSRPRMWSAWPCVNRIASTRVDAVRQRLLAQVGRGVDEDAARAPARRR